MNSSYANMEFNIWLLTMVGETCLCSCIGYKRQQDPGVRQARGEDDRTTVEEQVQLINWLLSHSRTHIGPYIRPGGSHQVPSCYSESEEQVQQGV